MNTTIHPFEAAGLGKAPFRYIGMENQALNAHGMRKIGETGGVEISTKPGGTCDYCGTYIVQMCNIVSADGNRFHVGCDCVGKVGDPELVRVVEQDAKKHRAALKANRDKARIAAATAKLPAVQGTLNAQPHPSEWGAKNGKTLLDYVRWMLENAGNAGKLRAAKMIEDAAK
jgi:hypothetical protein